jgi:hypothetical protein
MSVFSRIQGRMPMEGHGIVTFFCITSKDTRKMNPSLQLLECTRPFMQLMHEVPMVHVLCEQKRNPEN